MQSPFPWSIPSGRFAQSSLVMSKKAPTMGHPWDCLNIARQVSGQTYKPVEEHGGKNREHIPGCSGVAQRLLLKMSNVTESTDWPVGFRSLYSCSIRASLYGKISWQTPVTGARMSAGQGSVCEKRVKCKTSVKCKNVCQNLSEKNEDW